MEDALILTIKQASASSVPMDSLKVDQTVSDLRFNDDDDYL